MIKLKIQMSVESWIVGVALTIFVVSGIFGGALTARADPHAVFYTAIGQQQLFFNVLAALDQADYVEPALQRKQLEERRAQVGTKPKFEPEEQQLVRETEVNEEAATGTPECSNGVDDDNDFLIDYPQDSSCSSADDDNEELPGFQPPGKAGQRGTPSLLQRPITLEGADLYTDQLVRMFGAESARRNSMSELLRTFCDFGLGIKSCGLDQSKQQGESKELVKTLYRKAAVIQNPLEWNTIPFTNGVVAALYSGDPTPIYPNTMPGEKNPNPFGGFSGKLLNDTDFRWGKFLQPDYFGSMPFAYSPALAAWRKTIADMSGEKGFGVDDQEFHRNLLASTIKAVENTFSEQQEDYSLGIYPALHIRPDGKFLCLDEDQYGNFVFDSSNSPYCSSNYVPSGMTGSDYITWATLQASNLGEIVSNIASNAASRINKQQVAMEEQGVLADTILKSSYGQFAQCNDGLDNDNDGKIDMLDSDCKSLTDPFEGTKAFVSPEELTVHVNSPVAARIGTIYSIPNTLSAMDASQRASALRGLDVPGNKQLVHRGGAKPQCSDGIDNDSDGYIDYEKASPNAPETDPQCQSAEDDSEKSLGVQGISTRRQSEVLGINAQGQVLGTGSDETANILNLFDPKKYPFYDAPKQPTSPAANIIQPHLEQGAVQALRALTGNKFRGTGTVVCGFSCPVN